MKTVTFEYKCRRCSVIRADNTMGVRDDGFEAVSELVKAMVDHPLRKIETTCVHRCEDGGHGICDLVGQTAPKENS